MLLLGIDIGTSACKVAAFYPDGKVCGEVTKSYKVYYPKAGWAEQDPDEWYAAVCSGIKELLGQTGDEEIVAIGVDGQSWSAIPVDREGNVLHNTPIWFDTRATDECREIIEKIGFEKIFEVCKNPIKPSYTTPKVLWFKKNLPDIYQNTYKFLQCNSFINYKLTGIFSQDRSQGYGHFFFDMEKGEYDPELAKELGLDISMYPRIYECSHVIGTVTERAGRETGLKPGIPVVAGGLDAACGTLGAGVCRKGQTQEQGGQAGGMSICLDVPLSHEKLILGNHVVPGLWLLQGGTVGGGGTIKWFSEQFGKAFEGDNVFRAIDEEASKVAAGSDGVIFLPYMAGERSPVWNENAKGVYFGLSFDKTRAHLARATMEGVAYSLKHNLETAGEVGAGVDYLLAMGGSANSSLWMQIKADVTGKIIKVPNSDNASALGAAILAGIGIGLYGTFDEAIEKTISVRKTYIPDASNEKVYNENYNKYIKIYQNLKELM